MSTARERKQWALEMAAALLRSDLDTMDLDGFDEDDAEKRKRAITDIANRLTRQAEKLEDQPQ